MESCNVGTASIIASLLFSVVAALPRETPAPAVPVQISTTTDNAVFRVMGDDLVFYHPDPNFYVARQLWRASANSPTTYVSLQIYNPYTAVGSLSTVVPKVFITRDGGTQPQGFSVSSSFADYLTESRLFRMSCCGCAGGLAPVTFFYTGGQSTRMLSADYNNLSPVLGQQFLGQQIINESHLCTLSNLRIQLYPTVVPEIGPPHPTTLNRKRRQVSTNTAVVHLLADYGDELFIVDVRNSTTGGTFELFLRPYNPRSCNYGAAFYYNGYIEYHVNSKTGSLVSQSAFTLQHLSSRLFVVSDISDNMNINIPGTGLILKHAEEFGLEHTEFPDYRFFTRYDGRAFSFWRREDLVPSRNISYYSRDIHIFCALYHRDYCLLPAKSGALQLVATSPNTYATYPSLHYPSDGLVRFLENLDGSTVLPTFNFIPPDAYGSCK